MLGYWLIDLLFCLDNCVLFVCLLEIGVVCIVNLGNFKKSFLVFGSEVVYVI